MRSISSVNARSIYASKASRRSGGLRSLLTVMNNWRTWAASRSVKGRMVTSSPTILSLLTSFLVFRESVRGDPSGPSLVGIIVGRGKFGVIEVAGRHIDLTEENM